jgi:hypothetical protein
LGQSFFCPFKVFWDLSHFLAEKVYKGLGGGKPQNPFKKKLGEKESNESFE